MDLSNTPMKWSPPHDLLSRVTGLYHPKLRPLNRCGEITNSFSPEKDNQRFDDQVLHDKK